MSKEGLLSPGSVKHHLHEATWESDQSSARELLRHFSVCVKTSCQIEPELLEYLANAFDKILSGADPSTSLLRKKRGRPKAAIKEKRDIFIAMDVIKLVENEGGILAETRADARGEKYGDRLNQDIFTKVGKKYRLSTNAVKTAYYNHRDDAKSILQISELF